jgi:oligopeptide transport system ATP-binding protein
MRASMKPSEIAEQVVGSSVDRGDGDSVLLEVDGLSVTFEVGGRLFKAVDDVRFTVEDGEAVGLVGESGSGKSVTARSILGLTDVRDLSAGAIRYRGVDLVRLGESGWRGLRGREITLIPQNALAALNPVFSVGWQIAEQFRIHQGRSRQQARRLAVQAMERVGIPAATKRFDNYPHEFSGGMRQRAMIAMAVALDPKLVIADEPTTALDVTIEAQIIDLLKELRRENAMALIHITHDIDLVSSSVDRLIVMYAGRIMEIGSVTDVYHRSRHPYTRALLESRPSLGEQRMGPLPTIPGAPPKISAIPPGCPFHPRCKYSQERCTTERPALRSTGVGSAAACHFSDEIGALGEPRRVVEVAQARTLRQG